MGFFSWYTQDTNEPIYNVWQSHSEVINVNMVNPLTGECFKEESYDGYGVFGGKDFYVLLAEINREKIVDDFDWSDGDKVRSAGIALAFSKSASGESEGVLYPILVENEEMWKNYINCIPSGHEGQGYWNNESYEDEE